MVPLAAWTATNDESGAARTAAEPAEVETVGLGGLEDDLLAFDEAGGDDDPRSRR